ncbi:excalibur calcium-binding domain-containing protein [Corynebacterium aquatimens]
MTGLLVSTPFILIPGWWFFCLWQDDKRWNTYEEAVQSQQSVSQYLTDTDRDLLRGMGTIDPPEQFKRRWPIVILIAGALFFCSAFFQYKDDENIEGESSDPASLSGNVGEDPAHGRKQVSPGNSGSGDTYYPDCEAVWDELGRPIRSGEPGYDTHLDRDNDGVGCEVQPE